MMYKLRKRRVILGLAAGIILTGTLGTGTPAPAMSHAAPAANGDTLPHILSNDNRRPAGRLKDGVLTVRLEAKTGLWYPEGADGLARPVAAFAEEGGPLQNPGPMIRVPAGTEVRVTVRNALRVPLTLYGLAEHRGIQADTFHLEPGATHEMRFSASAPGLYYYAGTTDEPWSEIPDDGIHPVFHRGGPDSQLSGVILIDPPGTVEPARDRIFVITRWGRRDPTSATGIGRNSIVVINGLSWPHTERFEVTQGDSLHWRWVSLTNLPHPMHLHGFYFRVDGKGDGVQDTVYAPEQRRHAVTENMLRGQTMDMVWSPERPGNWLFHCHNAVHMGPEVALDENGDLEVHGAHGAAGGGAQHAMAKMILGIHVKPNGAAPAASRANEQAMRLLVRSRKARGATNVRYAYVLGGSAEESDPDALPLAGPTLVLEKDRPVAITIVNHAHEPAAVHWHGIELESFPDGVPDWSGMGSTVLRATPPHDSLTVRFTPPRSGTFMYHSHFNELQQISSGLYGAIVVLEPSQKFDPETDRVLLFSDAALTVNPVVGPFAVALLNGRSQPEPMELSAGVTYRFRLVNIRSVFPVVVALLGGDRPAEWRYVAKDGAALPPAQAVVRPAQLVFSVGEIHDVEFTPRASGDLTLRFGYPPGFRPPVVPVPEPTLVAVRVH
jgi:FtsP/CotA-like multicopper oxidase with cupredoxin domain